MSKYTEKKSKDNKPIFKTFSANYAFNRIYNVSRGYWMKEVPPWSLKGDIIHVIPFDQNNDKTDEGFYQVIASYSDDKLLECIELDVTPAELLQPKIRIIDDETEGSSIILIENETKTLAEKTFWGNDKNREHYIDWAWKKYNVNEIRKEVITINDA